MRKRKETHAIMHLDMCIWPNAISMDSKLKAALKTRFVNTYDRIRRLQKETSKSKIFVVDLPTNPEKFQRLHPETDIAIPGGWAKPPIDLDLMEILDGSMKCRGESSQVCLYQPPGDPQPTAELNQKPLLWISLSRHSIKEQSCTSSAATCNARPS